MLIPCSAGSSRHSLIQIHLHEHQLITDGVFGQPLVLMGQRRFNYILLILTLAVDGGVDFVPRGHRTPFPGPEIMSDQTGGATQPRMGRGPSPPAQHISARAREGGNPEESGIFAHPVSPAKGLRPDFWKTSRDVPIFRVGITVGGEGTRCRFLPAASAGEAERPCFWLAQQPVLCSAAGQERRDFLGSVFFWPRSGQVQSAVGKNTPERPETGISPQSTLSYWTSPSNTTGTYLPICPT